MEQNNAPQHARGQRKYGWESIELALVYLKRKIAESLIRHGNGSESRLC